MRLQAALVLVLLGGAGPRDSAAAPCVDTDGDGWTDCDGDCCDEPGECGDVAPADVNPGAFEVVGNAVDDDCSALTSDTAADICDAPLPSNTSQPLDYARAIDLCSFTVESPPLAERKWGVISAALTLADGTGTPAAASRSIRPNFGSNVFPHGGTKIAVLSTGHAAAPAHTSPNWVNPQENVGGANMGTSSPVPADWLVANDGKVPVPPPCLGESQTVAQDPVLLKLRIRVPTNARSFSLKAFLFASDYPEFVCEGYSDYFLALLDSGFVSLHREYATPRDKNIAVHDPTPARRGPSHPVSANLAFLDRGLFTQCKNGQVACAPEGASISTVSTCTGITELAGTGFDRINPMSAFITVPGYCGENNLLGGGTGWFTIRGNVVPGETIELRLVLWDTGDHLYDSVVLLDDFEWSDRIMKRGIRP